MRRLPSRSCHVTSPRQKALVLPKISSIATRNTKQRMKDSVLKYLAKTHFIADWDLREITFLGKIISVNVGVER
jgi:hypothetical protein